VEHATADDVVRVGPAVLPAAFAEVGEAPRRGRIHGAPPDLRTTSEFKVILGDLR